MGGVNFSGIASGLDTDLIIQSLLVNQQLRVDAINTRIEDDATRRRAFTDVKTSLDTFQDLVNDFSDEVFENRTIESTDESVLTATADGDSTLAQYDIVVNQLATRSVATFGAAQGSANAVIGAGSLNINLQGGESFNVTLTDSGSTLTDLRTAINDQYGSDLQASIIEVNPGSFELVVSTLNTGADFEILDDGDAGQSNIVGFSNAGPITTEQSAQNASFTLDGINITRAGNEITDVLEGVEFTLRGTGSTNLGIETDLDRIVSDFQEFANGYNDVLSQIDRVTNRETGVLAGDNDLNGLRTSLQGFITRFVPNIDQINIRSGGEVGITSLSQIGFETNSRTGAISVDAEDLRTALEDNFTEVQNLVLGNSTSSNPNVALSSNTGNAFSGTITLDTIADTASFDGSTPEALIRNGNILSTQSDSSFSGFIFSAGAASSSVTLQVSAGLANILDQQLETFTSFSGVINDRTSTIDSRTRSLERDLGRAEDRLENERQRLTIVFSRAEQAISALQGLQASLGAQTA
jgi:flagellar hook-associated protein 2